MLFSKKHKAKASNGDHGTVTKWLILFILMVKGRGKTFGTSTSSILQTKVKTTSVTLYILDVVWKFLGAS